VDERTDIIDALRHSSFEMLMAAAGKWCSHALGDVLMALLTDSPDAADVRQGAARVAKVQLRDPDTRSRRETGVLGARPMFPDGAHATSAVNRPLTQDQKLLADRTVNVRFWSKNPGFVVHGGALSRDFTLKS